jgi:hypothetical protein
LNADEPTMVMWSSLWPSGPGDQVRLDLMAMHRQWLKNLAPEGTEVLVLEHATSHPISP